MESAVEDGDGVPGEVDPVSVDSGGSQAGTGGRLQPGAQPDRREVTGKWPVGEPIGDSDSQELLCGTFSRLHQ